MVQRVTAGFDMTPMVERIAAQLADMQSTAEQVGRGLEQAFARLRIDSADILGRMQPMQGALDVLTERFRRDLAPGTYAGDIMLIAFPPDGTREDDRYQAVRRLATRHYTRGHVFHSARWHAQGERLRNAFWQRRGDRSDEEAWLELVLPSLWTAIAGMPEELPMNEVYDYVRRAVRRAVETELLGHTLDAERYVVSLDEWSDPRVPLVDDIMASCDARLDGLLLLRDLSDDDCELLFAIYVDGVGADLLAADLNITAPALRQRAHRAVHRVRRQGRQEAADM